MFIRRVAFAFLVAGALLAHMRNGMETEGVMLTKLEVVQVGK